MLSRFTPHCKIWKTLILIIHFLHQSKNNALKPGTSITISIKTGERKNVTLLPQRAVIQIQNGKGNIFVVEQNVARLKQVNIGDVYGSEIETQTKLSQSAKIIVENQHLLKDGMSVSVAQD